MSDAATPPRSAYLHVPFCAHRCGYCNFTLVAGRDDLVEPYLAALEVELRALREPRPVETLFLGGGTPTFLRPTELKRLLALVRRWFPPLAGAEFSVEANPLDLTPERVGLLAEAGVNRLSLGVQSFAEAKLAMLERDHRAADIGRGWALARPAFASLSLDLIFAAPGESLAEWEADLGQALALRPDHISTYGLTFERGTRFYSRRLRDDLRPVPEETERAQYAAAIDRLTGAGYEHYEVSNFARPGHHCRHNEVYWSGGEYYAAGPGAARHIAGERSTNHRSTTTWIRRLLAGESPVAESERLPPEEKARERLVFGLRRMEGVDTESFAQQTGYRIEDLAGPTLERYVAQSLLVAEGNRLRLSREGLFVSDALWPALLGK